MAAYGNFVWTRKNTLNLLSSSEKFMNFKPEYRQENKKESHTLFYQYQCIATTTEAYLVALESKSTPKFGVVILKGEKKRKTDLSFHEVKRLLQNQPKRIKDFTENQFFQRIINHEYLHQGQIIVFFRLAGIPFPKKFKLAWDL